MIGLLRDRKLPRTLRMAQRLLQDCSFSFDTVRTAAHRTDVLKAHFGLADRTAPSAETLLDTLAQQADTRTKRAIERMTLEQRRAAEDTLRDMSPDQQSELLQTLARDPDAGRVAHCSFIDGADQDSRADDRFA